MFLDRGILLRTKELLYSQTIKLSILDSWQLIRGIILSIISCRVSAGRVTASDDWRALLTTWSPWYIHNFDSCISYLDWSSNVWIDWLDSESIISIWPHSWTKLTGWIELFVNKEYLLNVYYNASYLVTIDLGYQMMQQALDVAIEDISCIEDESD